jgi:diphthine-ammonia ligase
MKLGVLFSGGKDSVFAMYKALQKGHEVVCLISVISHNTESYMFHTPNIHLTDLQAKALEIPLIQQATQGEKEVELEDLKSAIQTAKQKYQIEGVVTGAIESVYQATRIQKICDELDLWCFNPLWQVHQVDHLKELVSHGFSIIISAVLAEPFTKKWLGREINDKTIKELAKLGETHKINPAGEGGEFESLVLDGPLFKKRIEIVEANPHYSNHAGVFEIKEAKLVEK